MVGQCGAGFVGLIPEVFSMSVVPFLEVLGTSNILLSVSFLNLGVVHDILLFCAVVVQGALLRISAVAFLCSYFLCGV